MQERKREGCQEEGRGEKEEETFALITVERIVFGQYWTNVLVHTVQCVNVHDKTLKIFKENNFIISFFCKEKPPRQIK